MISLEQHEDFIRDRLDVAGRMLDLPALSGRVGDIKAVETLVPCIEEKVRDVDFFRTKTWESPLRMGVYRVTLYALVRELAAQRVAETGVLHGLSSAFLLQGIRDNGGGKLYSIDYPSLFEEGPANKDGFDDTLPPGCGSGWTVPEDLRELWDLRLGRSVDLLPDVLTEARQLDFFVHDSEHTYATMMEEFHMAWPVLRAGGVLLADNIDVNTSFYDFANEVGCPSVVMPIDQEDADNPHPRIRYGMIRKAS